VFKFPGILFCAALLLLAGCATQPDEPLPLEWSLTNPAPTAVLPTAPVRQTMRPAAPIRPATVPIARYQNQPPPQVSRPAPILTWTSLNRWAAENKLAAPRKVASSPVASYTVNSARGTLTLVIGSREAVWRGLEVNLGFAPEIIDDQVFVHGLDLQKNLEPLLLDPPPACGTNRVLVLDPGHGGANVGTHSLVDGRFEKEFTLDWARRIQTLLATNGWTVFLTRTNDTDSALSNRVTFAEAHHADVFISLHFNSAAPDTLQSGLETYCLTPTGMPSTLTRNFSDLWTDRYPNNYFDVENLQLAVRLHMALLRATGEEDRGVRRARFMGVLHGQRRPAILIEGGYLSNPPEAGKIENAEFREKLAAAVADALK
jgi:N-acetylmuramoyl-L-alanine amidase